LINNLVSRHIPTSQDRPEEAKMAPPNNQKRVKGTQVYRPFVYGTIAKPFNDDTNPKPPGTPADHTHSWTVFVKGVDDGDITYWCKKVQFKLHESIPNPLRSMLLPPAFVAQADNPSD
jgi:transcription initiation factor IIF auxiliary subunit